MYLWLLMILAGSEGHAPKPVAYVQLPETIYSVTALTHSKDAFYILDASAPSLSKVARNGVLQAQKKGRGQGPGEFDRPETLAVDGRVVYVGDLFNLHKFNADDLSFIEALDIGNNPMALALHNDKFFMSLGAVPPDQLSIRVMDTQAKVIESFHKVPKSTDISPEPTFAQGADGTLYILHAWNYQVDILDVRGNPKPGLKLKRPIQFIEKPAYGPFTKKYGPSMAAYKHWQTAWAKPSQIVLVKDRFLVLYFAQLQEDLLSYNHFLEIYDLETREKVLPWLQVKGSLVSGGDYFWLCEEREDSDQLQLVAYQFRP